MAGNSNSPAAFVVVMSTVFRAVSTAVIVAFLIGRALGPYTRPNKRPVCRCIGVCIAASGKTRSMETARVRKMLAGLSDRRSVNGFNMAANLLSRVDGRAIASEGTQAHRDVLNVLARARTSAA